jgi:hypothetical protein
VTIVCYRDGMLASDTQCYSGDVIAAHTHKIGRTKDGWLWAVTGRVAMMEKYSAWAEFHEGDPERYEGEHSDLILISPDGVVKEWIGEGWITSLPAPFRAWGSGMEMGLAAMEMGADARRAVEVASKYHTHCGGEIDVLELDEPIADEETGEIEPEPVAHTPPEWLRSRGLA